MAFASLGGEGFGLNNGYTSSGYSVGVNPVACAKGTCIDGGGARINAWRQRIEFMLNIYIKLMLRRY